MTPEPPPTSQPNSDPTTDELPDQFILHNGVLSTAGLQIEFHRTLRVGDEGANALPPGLGRFDIRSVRRFNERIPEAVRAKGGVLLPMYVREAMWMSFEADEPYAVQIGTGGVCVLTGNDLESCLRREPQNYIVTTLQPWIDGYKTATGEVRQFVGVPSGWGLSVEDQIAPGRSVGGMQIQVWRLTDEALARWNEQQQETFDELSGVCFSPPLDELSVDPRMEFGAGGRIVQEIYADEFAPSDWQPTPMARVWIHPVSIAGWCEWTGELAPATPVDTDLYARAGLPWFDWFDDEHEALAETEVFARLKSYAELAGLIEPVHVPVTSRSVTRIRARPPIGIVPGSWHWVPER